MRQHLATLEDSVEKTLMQLAQLKRETADISTAADFATSKNSDFRRSVEEQLQVIVTKQEQLSVRLSEVEKSAPDDAALSRNSDCRIDEIKALVARDSLSLESNICDTSKLLVDMADIKSQLDQRSMTVVEKSDLAAHAAIADVQLLESDLKDVRGSLAVLEKKLCAFTGEAKMPDTPMSKQYTYIRASSIQENDLSDSKGNKHTPFSHNTPTRKSVTTTKVAMAETGREAAENITVSTGQHVIENLADLGQNTVEGLVADPLAKRQSLGKRNSDDLASVANQILGNVLPEPASLNDWQSSSRVQQNFQQASKNIQNTMDELLAQQQFEAAQKVARDQLEAAQMFFSEKVVPPIVGFYHEEVKPPVEKVTLWHPSLADMSAYAASLVNVCLSVLVSVSVLFMKNASVSDVLQELNQKLINMWIRTHVNAVWYVVTFRSHSHSSRFGRG